jgi:hypothetical protein
VGTFAIAWVMTKFTEPIRLGVSVAIVPTVARWFGKKQQVEDINSTDTTSSTATTQDQTKKSN